MVGKVQTTALIYVVSLPLVTVGYDFFCLLRSLVSLKDYYRHKQRLTCMYVVLQSVSFQFVLFKRENAEELAIHIGKINSYLVNEGQLSWSFFW